MKHGITGNRYWSIPMWWKLSALPLGSPGHATDVTEGLSQLLHSHGLTAEGLRGALQAEFGVWKNQAVALGFHKWISIDYCCAQTPLFPQTATLRILCCQMWSDTCSDGSRHVGSHPNRWMNIKELTIFSGWTDQTKLRNWWWNPTKSQAFKINTQESLPYFNAHVSWATMNEPNQNSPPAYCDWGMYLGMVR